jgi:aspartate dehydrogenase
VSGRRVGLIGWGAIANDVARGLASRGHAVVVFARTPRSDGSSMANSVVRSTPDLIAAAPDLIVEAASQTAVREIVPDCLAAGRPVIVSSVGALADEHLFERLRAVAIGGRTELILPSGAIGALDYVRAARDEAATEVTYESRKPVAAWTDELALLGIDGGALTAPHVLYEGNARTAAARYPANLNVAATLALAGAGFERTRVRVVVDPAAQGNSHSIAVEGPLGRMQISIANKAAPSNPKSSLIVSRSILAAVDQVFSPVKML